MKAFTHLDNEGRVKMVDVSAKVPTLREAVAEGFVEVSAEVQRLIRDKAIPKGDVFTVAKIAGIQAAKETARWIPLCHPTAIQSVDIAFTLESGGVRVGATVKAQDKTGVEMEALCSVTAACLTLYDMCKAVDKTMSIGSIRLLRKSGGRSGTWTNPLAQKIPE